MLTKVMTVIKYSIVFPSLHCVDFSPLFEEEILIWRYKMDTEQCILKDNLNVCIPVCNFLRKLTPGPPNLRVFFL